MNKKIILLFSLILISCFSGDDIFLGEKKVSGSENLLIKIYQTDEFDMATSLQYELIDTNGSVVIDKSFITGTNDKLTGIDDFYATLYDSIFFVCYPQPEDLYIIRDLKKTPTREKEIMLEKLKSYNKNLKEK